MKQSFAIILVSVLGFTLLPEQSVGWANIPKNSIYTNTTAPNFTGVYLGTIPCADCQGITLELTLNQAVKSKSKTFVLKQQYLGKPANKNTHTITGKWFVATGNKQNPKAQVLQLIPDGKEDLMYFELMTNGSIRLLDRSQNPIKSKLNYTLKKQRS